MHPTINFLAYSFGQIIHLQGTYQFPWWWLFPAHDGVASESHSWLFLFRSSSLMQTNPPWLRVAECSAPTLEHTVLHLPSWPLSLSQVPDSFWPSGSRPRGTSCPEQQPERETRVRLRHQGGHPSLIACWPPPVHSFLIQGVWLCPHRSSLTEDNFFYNVPALQSTTVLYECLLFGRRRLTSSVTFSSSCHKHCM